MDKQTQEQIQSLSRGSAFLTHIITHWHVDNGIPLTEIHNTTEPGGWETIEARTAEGTMRALFRKSKL